MFLLNVAAIDDPLLIDFRRTVRRGGLTMFRFSSMTGSARLVALIGDLVITG